MQKDQFVCVRERERRNGRTNREEIELGRTTACSLSSFRRRRTRGEKKEKR